MADDAQGAEITLPEVTYTFEVRDVDATWGVARVMVRERLCAPFEAAVEVSTSTPPRRSSLLGARCALTLQRGALTRRFLGVITAVQDLGVNREARVYEVRFGPSLVTLAHRAKNRVWQGVDALAVVRDVLDDAGLYVGAAYSPPGAVAGDAPAPREYCVQFGESDLSFIQRLLAEEGVLYALGDQDGEETLTLFDARGAGGQPELIVTEGVVPVLGEGGATAETEGVRRIDLVSALTVKGVSLRDTDFTHPHQPLASATSSESLSVEQFPARFVLGAYDAGAHTYGAPDARRSARVALQDLSAQAEVAHGEGNVTGMRPGSRFSLDEGGERALRGEFLLTAVLHLGVAPDVSLGQEGAARDDRYHNVFECVPSARAWSAPALPRPRVMLPQVATVCAEPGSSEEICTDHYGRVLVRFPWDSPDARRGAQGGTRASCWLRVLQPWAGSHWGFHFTPRVGMEVVVQFLDGDPDRPFVLGCLPNAANVPPVELPAKRTQSAIRTQSSPGGGGYNELRFEDAAGSEEVYLRAQRDQRVEVLNDRAVAVTRDTNSQTGRDESVYVGRNRSTDIAGNEQRAVEGNLNVSVGGDALDDVTGDRTVITRKSLTAHVDQEMRLTVNDALRAEVGGSSGTSAAMTPDEVTVRAPKKHAVTVGDEAVSELTPEHLAVSAPKKITLVCGDSTVVVEPDRVLLQTKSGAKIELDGDTITLKTGGKIVLKGSDVKTNG
jgi:type VI secretion system secreted protein VgrG